MKQGNLLIIDDDPAIIYLVVRELTNYVEKIFSAKDGLEALEIFRTENIHCAICDMVMPGINGVDVIRQVREEGYQCPIIFYTGFGTENLMFEVSRYGAFDFVQKPDIKTLKEIALRGIECGFNANYSMKISDVLPPKELSAYWKLIRSKH
ncbi:MAG: hypothetical protein A2381_16545 [Bdellovibrionales bacterium RIFOXYB1_FULL_37_110]|nr:MAG: hypothetical protein A2181_07550 [Bdellovibrionales bacterium RIFOXYA1_FULL_38_20]OFZ50007.1 MAG: hypothetical protein A2417_18380 [Bdellovibrionales bacterium RIFOXYC1_FULL_37_79]OFZ59913.1 MAG: hypothetical protein A2381_16545 [Bdellovibrionales bacterium RIFOXYB1_FULL_37_110]OFZ63884.1 MAG: hypothetical protein A2577_05735 [Bdellovibrionales bacterium RIFOXYD1_FULL_36_51]